MGVPELASSILAEREWMELFPFRQVHHLGKNILMGVGERERGVST